MESRGAATSLFFSSSAIRNSEAFAKKTQLGIGIITKLDYSDCGTETGLTHFVTPSGINMFNEYYGGDFNNLIGQYFKLRPEDKWRLIADEVRDEIDGKTIIIRTAISCRLKNTQHVCIKCFGKHGYNKPMKFNLGNWASTQFNEPATQSLLSTKHYIVSADGGAYVLDDTERKYLVVMNNLIYIDFNNIPSKNIRIRVSKKELHSIGELKRVEDVDTIDSSRVSKVSSFTIEFTDTAGKDHAIVVIARKGTKYPIFSTAFLKQAIKTNYTSEGADYVIGLKGFPRRKPIAYVPDTMFDFRTYNSELRNLLLTATKTNKERVVTTGAMLTTLFDLVNSKLSCHISALAVITYAMSSRDVKNEDFALVRGESAPISKLQPLLRYRSLATLFNYGTVKNSISIDSVTPKYYGIHPLSVVLKPRELVDAERRGLI